MRSTNSVPPKIRSSPTYPSRPRRSSRTAAHPPALRIKPPPWRSGRDPCLAPSATKALYSWRAKRLQVAPLPMANEITVQRARPTNSPFKEVVAASPSPGQASSWWERPTTRVVRFGARSVLPMSSVPSAVSWPNTHCDGSDLPCWDRRPVLSNRVGGSNSIQCPSPSMTGCVRRAWREAGVM